MSALMIGAVGALLVYCAEHFDTWLCLVGIILTVLCAFFVASFRALRRGIHSHLEPDLVRLLRGPRALKQWVAFLVFEFVLLVSWVRLLWCHEPTWRPVWVIIGLVASALTVYWLRFADRTVGRRNA